MRVIKDSVIYLIGELSAKSIPFLMLPYLTRKLGPDGFGELSYYLTWLALFAIFIGLSQEGAVTRYFYFYGTKGLNNIVNAGYILNIVTTIVVLVGCLFFKAEIIAYIVIATAFQSLLNVQLALRQCQKRPIKYVIIQFLLSILTVVFTVVALEYFSDNLVKYRILSIVFANISTFFIASFLLREGINNGRLTFDRLKIGMAYVASYGFPLILHQSSFFIKGQLDRLFIYEKYSKADLGIYSAGVQIAAILPMILMALNKAVVPYYYQNLKSGVLNVLKLKKYSRISLLFCILPAFVAYIIPVKVYTWVLSDQYSESKYFVVTYLLGYGLNLTYLILVNYFFYFGKNKFISLCSLISSLLYVGFLIYFSNISLKYIPFALFLSNVSLVILFYIFMEKQNAD
ncbi:oligosaccharide flippase family protein [Acinetobacter ursingii]|uniref:oligosaccharide flippase family protein n=1 Tax=Acinetobacter ursingii TaxID=108980 RepID=UPI0021CD5002|nr:oligosaccharide flippase family protein [Acinetobacter ursingii]MCU4482542.1 oligosaccharide flippase family protein [Acinetobacter ursingii]MCU4506818.1 oligosaccharide flippase family protein [Acinetobacter ursingii]